MYILRLNNAGQPLEWLTWQETVCLYSRELITWSLGEPILTVHGGINRCSQRQTIIQLPSIVASDGAKHHPILSAHLTNRSLFARDNHQCMYCGQHFSYKALTRDHIIPRSRGGKDEWTNVVASCLRCNQHKKNYLLSELNLSLIALPYRPNISEYLALINSRRILPDQAAYLQSLFTKNCRWQPRTIVN